MKHSVSKNLANSGKNKSHDQKLNTLLTKGHGYYIQVKSWDLS